MRRNLRGVCSAWVLVICGVLVFGGGCGRKPPAQVGIARKPPVSEGGVSGDTTPPAQVVRVARTALQGGGGLDVDLPADAPKDVRVAAVEKLDTLPPPDKGAALLAAGVFEPEGARFPAGVVVTWPLASRRSPGEKLYIAVLDETALRWFGTGELATVTPAGDRAQGMVYHFSQYALSDKAPEAMAPSRRPAVVDPRAGFTKDKKEEKKDLVPKVSVKSPTPPVITKPKLEDAVKAWREITGGGGDVNLSLDQFKKAVAKIDYAMLKTMIEDGTIPERVNRQLGDWRIFMLVDALKDFCAKNPGVKVYRSDTGNQKNAYLSDVDQTLYVYRYENGEWKRWPEGDVLAKTHTQQRLREQGVTMERMEVETMPGRDRFLDERIVSAEADKTLPTEIAGKKRGVVIMFTNLALGRQPGAYFLAGTVKQLQQLRVADQASKHLQATIHPDDRPIIVSETKELIGRLNGQVCTEIGPPEDNPKGAARVREGTYEDARRVLMDGIEPDLQRGWAYDSSVDNWFKYNEKVKYTLDPHKAPPVKYVLRAVNNGPAVLATLDNKMGFVEYERLNDAQRRQFLIHCYGEDLAKPRGLKVPSRDGASIIDRWKLALDISAEIRNISAVEMRPVTEADLQKAFRPLAERCAGPGNESRWMEFLGQARHEYNTRCQEIMTHNMVATSKERILGWLTVDPDNPARREEMIRHVDEPEIRRALRMDDPRFDAKWQSIRKEIFGNYADTARMQILFSFRYMDQTVIKAILEQAESNSKLSREDVARVRELAAEATDWRFHYNRYQEVPTLYHHIVGEWTRYHLDAIQGRLKDWVLEDIGWTNPTGGERVPSPVAKKLGLSGMDSAVQGFFNTYNRTAGFGARFVRNMTMDIGNVDGVAKVLQTWSDSGGDPEAIRSAIVWETVTAVPVLGQALAITQIRSVGDAAQMGVLMGCAMYTPAGRYAMIVFSLGESGVAIYQSDYRAPLANAVADTIYRGWAGPSLYEFGQPPQQFTEAEQAELDSIRNDRRLMQATLADKNEVAGLLAREKALEAKKERWKGYVTEQSRNEGGALTGTAAQLVQKPLELEGNPLFPDEPKWMGGPLLARVTPKILFTSSKDGPVEFYLPPLTSAERTRLGALKAQSKTEQNPITQLDIAQELEALVARDETVQRAQRYIERAKTNRELMHQIRLDSLWPCMLEDKSNDLVGADRYVDEWLAVRRQKIVDALAKLGVAADYQALRDAKEQLSARLIEDQQRSRQRWEDYEKFKKGREKAVAQWYENAKIQAHVEALMIAVEDKVDRFSGAVQSAFAEAGLDKEYTAALEYFGEAIANRHRPVSPPTVKFGGRILRGDPDAKKAVDKDDVFLPEIKVRADPEVYVQPYSYSVCQLSPEAARQAVASRTFKGLPLDDAAVKTLKDYIEKVPAPKKQDEKTTPAFLVFAFCSDVKIPDRVVPKTAESLPRLAKYAVPNGSGQAYLLGGAAMWADLEPRPEKGMTILVRRPPYTVAGGNTEFVVTTDALKILDGADIDKTYPIVKFTIQAATSKDGPWVTTEGAEFSKYNREITKENQDQEDRRIAENRVVLVDAFTTRAYDELKLPVEPLWYRVGMKAYFNLKEPKEEKLSDPAEPSRNAVILLRGTGAAWPDWHRFETKEIPFNQGSVNFEIAMGPNNQAFHYPGAHLILTEGTRKFHYFTQRWEGGVAFKGGFRGWSSAPVDIDIPDGKTPLHIEGTWRDLKASRDVTIVTHMHDSVTEGRRKDIERARQELERQRGYDETELENYQREIARRNEYLAERAKNPPQNFREEEPYAEAECKRIFEEHLIRKTKEYKQPCDMARFLQWKAPHEHNWPEVVMSVKMQVAACRKAADLQVEMLRQQRAVWVKAFALPGAPADATERLKGFDQQIARSRLDYLRWLAGGTDRLKLLRDAAAPDAYKELADECLAITKEYEYSKESDRSWHLGDFLMRYGEDWALLTGDREKAASLYAEGYRIRGHKPPLEQLKELPSWWPEGKGGTVSKPEPPHP